PAGAGPAGLRRPLRVVPPRGRRRLTPDAARILVAQAARAFAYGLGSVVVGYSLERRGLGGAEVGAVLAAILAGNAAATLAVGRYGDRIGRRRLYLLLLALMAGAGSVFALTAWP